MSNKNDDGELQIRTLAMPADANPMGDLFGGWVVSQMDLAATRIAQVEANGNAITVAIDSMSFITPIHVGDFICCYGKVLKIGNTSIKIKVTTYAVGLNEERRKVTEGVFTFVAVDDNHRPRPVKK